MSARITLYENGLERNIDSLGAEEIDGLYTAIIELIGDFTVDLYSGYVFGINKIFVMNFCVQGELFPIEYLEGWQVEFTYEQDDDDSSLTLSEDSDESDDSSSCSY